MKAQHFFWTVAGRTASNRAKERLDQNSHNVDVDQPRIFESDFGRRVYVNVQELILGRVSEFINAQPILLRVVNRLETKKSLHAIMIGQMLFNCNRALVPRSAHG
jgi:hypothetical protein